MLTKWRLNQLKSIKTLAIEAYKKRKFKASLIINLQPKIKNNKLSTTDIRNTKDKSKTWFWNNSAKESNLDIEKGKNDDENESDLKIEESRKVSTKVCKKIKWNKERKNKLYRLYEIRLKAMLKRQ